MRKHFTNLVALLLFTLSTVAQKTGDSKILTKVADTSNLYNKVKLAMIKGGFTVRDDMNPLVLITNVSVKKHLGYTVIRADIRNDTVIVKGFYSNKNQNVFDIEINGGKGKYNKIAYFEGGYGWDLLYAIATNIDAQNLSFSK
jgi:hypothetical protein